MVLAILALWLVPRNFALMAIGFVVLLFLHAVWSGDDAKTARDHPMCLETPAACGR
jgi:hypothetical protein